VNNIPEGLVKLVIVVLLPMVMCFGYYSVSAQAASGWVVFLAMLALPLLLLGIGGLVWSHSGGIQRLKAVWWSCIIVAVASLGWIWG